MIEQLVVLHVLLLFFIYRAFKRDFTSPSFIFIGGFALASYIAYSYKNEWNMELLHSNTFWVIASGSITFFLVELFYRKKYSYQNNPPVFNQNATRLSTNKLIIFAIFQTLIYFLYYRKQMSFVGYGDWSDAISAIDQDNKFGDKSFSVPVYIKIPHAFCQVSGYVWICLFSYYLKLSKSYNKIKLLLGINMVLSMFGSLLSGGRMPLLGYILPLGIMLYLLHRRKNQKSQGSFKQQLGLVLVGVIFILSFSKIGSMIGRHETDNMSAEYVFAVYCGAPIKNLDLYINSSEPTLMNKDVPFPSTLYAFYEFFSTRLGFNIKMKEQSYSFLSNGEYFLGNVYTCYRSFYNDTKMFSFILAGFMALLACILHRRFRNSTFFQTGVVDINVFLYCFFSMGLVLSFFSELFLRRLLSVEYFIRTTIYFYMVIYILYGKIPSKHKV